MGTGHIMRCLALAQAWQDAGGNAVFAMAQSTPGIEARLRSEGVTLHVIQQVPGSADDAESVSEAAHTCGVKWVVVDGYHFGVDYQRILRNAGVKVLMIDDTGSAEDYSADLVLNQNVHASAEMYESCGDNTRLLLGSRYALLRREFASQHKFRRDIPEVGRNVLVTLGGSDPENVTSKVIAALGLIESPELEVVVIAGGSNSHLESLRAAATNSARSILLLSNVSNMAEWMIWADVAVSAAGSTCWEICRLGLPSVLLDIAPNQAPIAAELHRLGAAVHISNATASPMTIAASLRELILSKERRAAISEKAVRLVDGRGAQRVVTAIRSHGLRVRAVGQEDCRLLWEWANDPAVRSASFSQAPIPWENHQAWFADKMNDPNSLMFIAEDEQGRPIGQFRLDRRSPGTGEVAISIASDARGAGYGTRLIELGVSEIFSTTGIARLLAYIRPENQASIRSFEGAGFNRQNETRVKGCSAIEYVRDRDEQST